MKWTALILVLIGLVVVDGAWEHNQEYRFRSRTLPTSPELNNQRVDIVTKTRSSLESSDSSSSSSSESAETRYKKAKNNEIYNKKNECHTLHQTQYVRVADKICFSARQLPICSKECKVEGKQTRQVDAYCLHEKDAATQLYLRNIQQGRNPRMGRYPTNNKVSFNLPLKCEDELGINKDLYRSWLNELDDTLTELTGY